MKTILVSGLHFPCLVVQNIYTKNSVAIYIFFQIKSFLKDTNLMFTKIP